MAEEEQKKKIVRKAAKKVATRPLSNDTQRPVNGDFNLNPEHYDQSHAFEVYLTEKKVTKVFGLRNKKEGDAAEVYIKARTRSKTPRGWRFIYGIDVHGPSQVSRLIRGFLSVAKRLGWNVGSTDDLEKIKLSLRESEETIIGLERSNQELRVQHEALMVAFRQKQEEILHSRVDEFHADMGILEGLLHPALGTLVPEQDLQEFLYSHSWLFGTEYINAQPQVLRGAHNRFDFYLERFNKTNDIVEIKLASDPIVNKDGSVTAKVIQAVDQLIDYMEGAQAVAHSAVLSEEEGIKELRPRGIVIIGTDTSLDAKRKLHKWNYQFAHITILTYEDVLERAKSVLEHLKTDANGNLGN